MRTVTVLEEAAKDIEEAREFYDGLESGVGDYFADSLLADVERLGLFHGIHPKHFGLNRMLAERFPFGIYYRETSRETQVIAILDLRKNPTWIRSEIGKRREE